MRIGVAEAVEADFGEPEIGARRENLLYHHSSEKTVGYKPQFRIVKVIIIQIAATDSSTAGVDLLYLSCFKETKGFMAKRGDSDLWNCSVQNDCERSNVDARNGTVKLPRSKA